jgi:hypothetical protein
MSAVRLALCANPELVPRVLLRLLEHARSGHGGLGVEDLPHLAEALSLHRDARYNDVSGRG